MKCQTKIPYTVIQQRREQMQCTIINSANSVKHSQHTLKMRYVELHMKFQPQLRNLYEFLTKKKKTSAYMYQYILQHIQTKLCMSTPFGRQCYVLFQFLFSFHLCSRQAGSQPASQPLRQTGRQALIEFTQPGSYT